MKRILDSKYGKLFTVVRISSSCLEGKKFAWLVENI